MNNNRDIKTALKLLVTEVVMIAVFIGFTFVSDGLLYLVWGGLLITILVNLFWGIRLYIRKPKGYALWTLLLQLPLIIVLALFAIIINAMSGVTC
jgi:hypothetical protein